jgi:hypothetical protein
LAQNNNSQVFIENKGQWNSEAKFFSNSKGVNQWITNDGVVYDFHKAKDASIEIGHVVRMRFTGAGASGSSTEGELPLSGKLNYFKGNRPDKWVFGVRRFTEAATTNIYSGISVRHYFEKGAPRYDLVVQPGANLGAVAMKFEGATGVKTLPNGNLAIGTSLGDVEEQGLFAYQMVNGVKTQIPCSMDVQNGVVRFSATGYDKTKALVVDPLVYATGFGDAVASPFITPIIKMNRHGQCITTVNVFGEGDEYGDFPATTGAYQTTLRNKSDNIYVFGLSADGSQLAFGTYLSGDGPDPTSVSSNPGDSAYGMVLDNEDNIILCGSAASSNFPTTPGAFQATNPAPQYVPTSFVAKLSSDGSKLLTSSYVGGQESSGADGVALDSQGNYWVTGSSDHGRSPGNFPVTPNAFVKSTPSACGFLYKLSANGSHLLYSTLLGGQSENSDYTMQAYNMSVCVDSHDNAITIGTTNWPDFPTTVGAYQRTLGPKTSAETLVKVSSSGQVVFSTYFHGQVAVGWYPATVVSMPNDNVCFSGNADVAGFPLSPNAYQDSLTDKPGCTFVAQLSPDGKRLVYSTFLGNTDASSQLDVDYAGNIALGTRAYRKFPVTDDAFLPSFDYSTPWRAEPVAVILSPDETQLEFSSVYYGTSGDEVVTGSQFNSVCFGTLGTIQIASQCGESFPMTPGAYNSDGTTAAGFVANFQTKIWFALSGPETLMSGSHSNGTIILPKDTPNDLTLSASSDNPAVHVDPQVTVLAGSHEQGFSIVSQHVDHDVYVTISASYQTVTRTFTVRLVHGGVAGLAASQSSIAGSQTTTGTVTLNAVAGGSGALVTLNSNSPAVTVPTSAPVYNGSIAGSFQIKTSAVSVGVDAQVTASYNGTSKTITLVINPALQSLAVTVPSVVGGNSATGVVKFAGKASPSGAAVQLKSSSSAAVVPAGMAVLAGQTAGTFTVASNPVDSAATVTLSATSGGVTTSSTITIAPAQILTLTLYGGGTTIKSRSRGALTVNLNGKAGPSGRTLTLTSSDSSVQVTSTAKLASGQSYAYVAINALSVTSAKQVTITVKDGVTTKTLIVTIQP